MATSDALSTVLAWSCASAGDTARSEDGGTDTSPVLTARASAEIHLKARRDPSSRGDDLTSHMDATGLVVLSIMCNVVGIAGSHVRRQSVLDFIMV
jgi:hypothetical protein